MIQITKGIKRGLVTTSLIVSWSEILGISRGFFVRIKSFLVFINAKSKNKRQSINWNWDVVLGERIEVVLHALILQVTGNYSLSFTSLWFLFPKIKKEEDIKKGQFLLYVISLARYLLESNLVLILLTLFLCYYFPIIVSDVILSPPSWDMKELDYWNFLDNFSEDLVGIKGEIPLYRKSNISIFNLLGYFTITFGIGYIKHKFNLSDLFKLLLFSLKQSMFSILNINFIKTRLIYLILILPFLFIIFGDYTYLLLNFGLIFNNIIMLQIFIINKDKKFLSKIWQGYLYILLNDIFMLGLIYIFKDSPFLLIGESPNSNNGSSSSNEGESNPNNSNPNFKSTNFYFNETESNQEDKGFIDVLTTLPIKDELPIIYTDRLIIRAPIHSDIDAYYSLRTQPQAMTDSSKGIPDANLSITLNKLERLIKRDNDSVYFFIFLKNLDGSEGNLIGDGGVHNLKSDSTGWPEFGYKFKKEFWGKGYATEFGKAFMEFWANIPRKDVEIPVNPSSINYYDNLYVKERLTAYTRNENLASQNVLWKLGFQSFKGLKNGLINWQKII